MTCRRCGYTGVEVSAVKKYGPYFCMNCTHISNDEVM